MTVATGQVTTLAGSPGSSGASDGTGAAARFKIPLAVAVDGAGNLFAADTGNNTIRQVVVATGAVTTLAGTAGQSGGSDGTGAAARFNTPGGIAVDGAGHLYVIDSANSAIRTVAVATGVVTTLAGVALGPGHSDGTGAAARFFSPVGAAVDAAGNLFVADTGNSTIRQVVVATGAVTTLAGSWSAAGSTDGMGAAALFNSPQSVAVDGAGNLYVTESGNSTVRKVAVASGAVTTLAGTPPVSGSSDGTGAAVRFNRPSGVTADGAGNPYGNYGPAYLARLGPTGRRQNHGTYL